MNIYAHSFQEAQARAMTSVADCIYGKNAKLTIWVRKFRFLRNNGQTTDKIVSVIKRDWQKRLKYVVFANLWWQGQKDLNPRHAVLEKVISNFIVFNNFQKIPILRRLTAF